MGTLILYHLRFSNSKPSLGSLMKKWIQVQLSQVEEGLYFTQLFHGILIT